jgi:hypothetical protein
LLPDYGTRRGSAAMFSTLNIVRSLLTWNGERSRTRG